MACASLKTLLKHLRKMKKIKIALGDLRHKTIGRNCVFMPVGIGYIAAYALAQIDKEDIEIRLYDDPDIILKEIDTWNPDIIGLANYCWNSELSKAVFRYANKKNHSVVCIAGGPDFPVDKRECEKYLLICPEIDFYNYFEGEIAFSQLIKKIIDGVKINLLKSIPQRGVMSIHPKTKKLVFGEPPPRLTNLDVIPSPYINGLMDQWFNGYYAPCIETARGCSFTCGFCFTGQKWYSNVATFSVKRIKDELTYIAEKIKKYPDILLSICDSNFGMYKRDEEIAGYLRKLQDKQGWPSAFDVTTGKANYERILKVAALVKNKMQVTCSVQSLNPKTLQVIKRRNLPIGEYRQIQEEIKKRGMLSVAELITPMPEETKKSFLEGMKTVIEAGVEHVVPYTTMLLKGTYLASKECRKKYKMKTKFRILPRQFGEYVGEKCFEIEEVCISTNTISYNDYLSIRGFALISAFFSGEYFDIIHKHLKELGIGRYDFCYHLWNLIKSGNTSISPIYNRYIQETKDELWDSPKAIYEYYKKPANYNKLLTGKAGDNLIRKYSTQLFLECCIPAVELAYASIKKLTHIFDKETFESLDSAQRWTSVTRDLSNIFKNNAYLNFNSILSLPYDVNCWYHSNTRTLVSYKKPVHYRIFYDNNKLDMILNQGKKLYGEDNFYRVGKLFINWSIKNFWTKCEQLKEFK